MPSEKVTFWSVEVNLLYAKAKRIIHKALSKWEIIDQMVCKF